MALELPGWVVIAFNYAGLPWPGIDEDELRAWAASVRKFAGDITDNSARTHRVVADLADSSQSSFTAAMAARWQHHNQLVSDLHEPLNVFADALDVAADAVVAQKLVVIGAAIAFATEFAATQIGAFFTLGADEAALPEEIISTREIVNFAIEELKGALIGELLNVAVAQVNDHISGFIGNLFGGGLQVVTEYQSLRLSYGYMRDAASAMRGQAAETEETGESAYSENANRDLEDPGEGGAIDSGWASVVQAVKQALLDLALDLFRSVPQVIMRAQEDSADAIEAAVADTSDADRAAAQAAPHDSGRGPSAGPGTGAGAPAATRADVTWPDVTEEMPTDSSGRPLTVAEAEHLGLTPQQIRWLHDREAPLGMTPEQFRDFRSSLYSALREDGIAGTDADVRLQGSSARGFSGAHKEFLPRPGEEGRGYVDSPEGQGKLADWPAAPRDYPANRPFDAGHKLGFDKPSDYDVQISSDAMISKAAEVHAAKGRDPDTLINRKYGFLNKKTMRETFPALDAWKERWEAELHREVNPAVFRTAGPPDTSSTGVSSHFQDSDWRIFPSGGRSK